MKAYFVISEAGNPFLLTTNFLVHQVPSHTFQIQMAVNLSITELEKRYVELLEEKIERLAKEKTTGKDDKPSSLVILHHTQPSMSDF